MTVTGSGSNTGALAGASEGTVENCWVTGQVTGEGYTGGFVGDMGGSSGAILQTCTGNAINNQVHADAPNCIAGYWSSSRPIVDDHSVNYAVNTLTQKGMSNGTDAFVSKPASEFAAQEFYEELGWDFGTAWTRDAQQNCPVPRVIEVSTSDQWVTIIATASRGGTIQPEGYTLVQRGGDQTFTFTANEYYEIASVKIDGVENSAAAAAGSYTFVNVTDLHTIDVSFRLSDETSGRAPSLVSTSAYYNRTQEKHIDLTVDFGEGGLGIPQEDWRSAVESVQIQKDGQLVLDCNGCYWFPSTGYGYPENILQICYDDMQKQPDYDQLVSGSYDLVITFRDVASTVCTIPLAVVEQPVHTLPVEGGTISADGVESGTAQAQVAEQTVVTITPTVPSGQRFSKWEITGLEGMDATSNPLMFTMPSGDVSVTAQFRTAASQDSGNDSSPTGTLTVSLRGTGSGQSFPFTVTFTDEDGDTLAHRFYYNGDSTGTIGNNGSFTLSSGEQIVIRSLPEGTRYTVAVDAGDSNAVTSTGAEGVIRTSGNRAAFTVIPTLAASDPSVTGVSSWLNTTDHITYLTGCPDGSFGPDRSMTRAEVAQMFYALLQNKNVTVTKTFSDVPTDAWYATAVNTLASLGMVSGDLEGSYRPNDPVTRAEFCAIALGFAHWQDGAACSFTDVSAGDWFYPYVAQAANYGWAGGYPNGSFEPDQPVTRAQVTTIVNNMLGRTISTDSSVSSPFSDLTSSHWAYEQILTATGRS